MIISTATKRELLFDPLPGSRPEFCADFWASDQEFHRRHERLDIRWRDEDTCSPIHHLPDPANIGGDTRQANCHGLKEGQWQVLVERGQNKRVRALKPSIDVGTESWKLNAPSGVSRHALATSPVSPVSQHRESKVAAAAGDGEERLYEQRSGL